MKRCIVLAAALLGCGEDDAVLDDEPGAAQDVPGAAQGQTCDALQGVDGSALRAHLDALAAIAEANGGNRAAGFAGYDASADYVEQVLLEAGLSVERQPFEIRVFFEKSDAVLEVDAEPVEFGVAGFSGSGDVTAPVTAVDVALGLDNETTSGCEPEDFDGFPAGNVALIQRGVCTFADKAAAAEAAGAAAVVVFNRGSTQKNRDLFSGTLGSDAGVSIPVVLTAYDVGADLVEREVEVHIVVDAVIADRTTVNLIAQTPTGDDALVPMYGAHLDSVPDGPGINDNGSGSAALLEAARAAAGCDLEHAVRFAWWGAEEIGLVGSQYYVDNLPPEERERIRYYLNYDMVASPNFVRFVYDGDGSAFEVEGPGDSAALEAILADYFTGLGLPSGETAFSGRSDYAAFIDVGIPAGGMFTGAEGKKSQEEREVYGGEADKAYDGCYHRRCDGPENVDMDVLRQITGSVLHTIELYAL